MVNAQGLTALDIVNMYTDPRSAGQMKLVLQGKGGGDSWEWRRRNDWLTHNFSVEALAQQARVRMAQQQQHYQQKGGHPHHMDPRAGHPHHMDPRGGHPHHMDPRAGHPHHMDPRGGQSHHMDPRAGQSHHMDPRGGQAHYMDQRRAQAHHMDQRGGHPHHMDPRAGQSHHMPLQDQRGAQFLPHQHPSQVAVSVLCPYRFPFTGMCSWSPGVSAESPISSSSSPTASPQWTEFSSAA